MNILWVQDLNFLAHQHGGAEISDSILFAYGLTQLGYNIDLMTPEIGDIDRTNYDVVIISNAVSFNKDFLLKIMSEAKKVIFYAHDFWDICKWRLFRNNQDRCRTTCPELPYAKKFWEHIDGAVWLSPLHRQSYLFSLPEFESKPHILMPSPIDITPFVQEYPEIKRVSNTVIGNNILLFKGSRNILSFVREHKEMKFTFVGAEPEDSVLYPSNVSWLGQVRHNDMPKLMKAHEYAIELPTTNQPFERFMAESAISGCNLIINENVGCSSYPWFYTNDKREAVDVERLKKEVMTSPKMFWKFVGGL